MNLLGHHRLLPPGILFALFSALLFGASTPFAKLLLGTIDPWMLAGLLYLGSGLGLGVLWLGRRLIGAPAAEAPLRTADLPWLAGIVLAGGAIGPVLLIVGLTTTSASSTALLLNLENLATMANRLGGLPRERGPPASGRSGGDSRWRCPAVTARRARRVRVRRNRGRRGLHGMGHR